MIDFATPNFRGKNALIVHRESENIDRLKRQLERVGLHVESIWPQVNKLEAHIDVIFFDGDNAFDGVFPWNAGQSPIPMVALLSSEAPGRLEWVLRQGISAHLMKPIGSGGVFSALIIGFAHFAQQQKLHSEIEELKSRSAMRPSVIKAVISVMGEHGIDEDAAYALIRSEAMKQRQSVEKLCLAILARDNNTPDSPGSHRPTHKRSGTR